MICVYEQFPAVSDITAGRFALPRLLTCWRLPRALRHPALSSVLDEGRGILGFAYIGNRWTCCFVCRVTHGVCGLRGSICERVTRWLCGTSSVQPPAILFWDVHFADSGTLSAPRHRLRRLGLDGARGLLFVMHLGAVHTCRFHEFGPSNYLHSARCTWR